jgi:hypothetical protein
MDSGPSSRVADMLPDQMTAIRQRQSTSMENNPVPRPRLPSGSPAAAFKTETPITPNKPPRTDATTQPTLFAPTPSLR